MSVISRNRELKEKAASLEKALQHEKRLREQEEKEPLRNVSTWSIKNLNFYYMPETLSYL